MTILDQRSTGAAGEPSLDQPEADSGHDPIEGRPARLTQTGRSKRSKRRRRRRVALLVFVALVVPVGWSYGGYLTAAGDAPTSVRSVDWLRDHGFESVVNNIEQWYYTRTKPQGKRVPTSDLPKALRHLAATSAGGTSSGSTTTTGDRIAVVARPVQAGEGVWRPVTGLAVTSAAVSQTFLRPDPTFPSVGVNLVRIDQRSTKLVLVPGTREPGGTWAWGSQIPVGVRQKVIAAFNAGFKFRHTAGGMYAEGREAVRPLQDGLASIVIHRDGTADVAKWGRDASMSKDIASVRQNLALIVDHGKPVSGLVTDRNGQWGTLKSQLQFTWRSGVGVDAQGRLIYAAGHKMTLTQLATALTDAGAIRAMQLDIHDNVVTFNWFRPRAGTTTEVDASKLTPAMTRDATRYLVPDQRDFLAVEAR